MCLAQRIKLENAIYASASKLRTVIHARGGRLVCTEKNAYLQALLEVYNAFFGEDNWKNFCTHEYRPRQLKGILFHTVLLSKKEYKFELLVGGNNAS